MKQLVLLMLFSLLSFAGIQAQSDSLIVTDSIETTSTLSKKEKKKRDRKNPGIIGRLFPKNYPFPKRAAHLSLAFPGLGQAYNKRFWKLPFVYAAYGGLIYSISFNTGEFRRFRDAFALELEGEEHEFSASPTADATTLKQARDFHRKNLELSYIGLVIVHLLSATEAFVDAHLLNFDVSDDLSLELDPSFQYEPIFSGPSLGLGIALRLKTKKVTHPRPFLSRP